MAASPSGPPLLAERADIHKSCKAIESLLNVLDDYGQVASAMATLEKKLAKAMRELAGLKITADIAANAFNTSASLFETLADVSTKFAKVADKEYEGTGAEVRKWFKKLAREEKAHDERLFSASAKIKQASQAYEKKSRKNPRDAAEEHARYFNLISSLGPEISKDKFDHGTYITRQHILTTYGVAACLTKIADAEWVRVCESLRRFSPTIGPLGEWRALCEGGWEKPLPHELPDIDAIETEHQLNVGQRIMVNSQKPDANERGTYTEQREANSAQFSYAPSADLDGNLERSPQQGINPPSAYTRHGNSTYTSASTSSGQGPNQSTDSSPLQPPRPLVDPNTGSIRSLSAFPPPPTHFPIPPPRPVGFQSAPSGLNPNVSTPVSSPQNDDTTEELPATTTGVHPTQDVPSDASIIGEGLARSESPEQSLDMATSESSAKATEFGITGDNGSSSYVAAMRHRYTNSSGTVSPPLKDMPRLPTRVADLAIRYESSEPPLSPARLKRASHLIRRQNNNIAPVTPIDTSPHFKSTDASERDAIPSESDRHDQMEARELAKERQLLQLERELELKAREIEREREELVRARRDIARQPPSPSGPPPFSQQHIPRSQDRNRQQQLEVPFPASQTDTAESPSSASRNSYHSAHSSSQLGQAPLSPSPTSSVQQVNHLLHSPQPLPNISQHAQRTSPSPQPASQTYARSPQNVNYRTSGPPADMLPRPATQSMPQSKGQQHPPYCGCERCAAKYRELPNPAPSSHTLRPPDQPITLRPSSSGEGSSVSGGGIGGKRSAMGEKSKVGWMRRLSMPVVMGHALNLDSSSFKKGHRESSSGSGLYTLGAGIGNTPLPSPQSRGGLFSLDGKRNASATNLRIATNAGVSVREDGKLAGRRSYETNLAAGRNARR